MIALDAITISRAAQLILSIITLGINAAVVQWFNTHEFVKVPGYAPFLVFASIWTALVSLPYTTFCPIYFPSYINRYFSLAAELITAIFWFSGFIAGAVWLGTIDRCGGIMCSNARAGVVFAALIFVCCCVTAFYPIKYTFFTDDDQMFGEGRGKVGMSGANRMKGWKTRRENAATMEHNSDEKGFGRITKALKGTIATTKVRMTNALDEWKTKAGRSSSTVHTPEMRQNDMV